MNRQQRNALVLFLCGILFNAAGLVLILTIDDVLTTIVIVLGILLLIAGWIELWLSIWRPNEESELYEDAPV